MNALPVYNKVIIIHTLIICSCVIPLDASTSTRTFVLTGVGVVVVVVVGCVVVVDDACGVVVVVVVLWVCTDGVVVVKITGG